MNTWRAQALHGICLCLAVGLAQAAPFGYTVNSDSPGDDAFSLVRVDLATGDYTVIGPTGYIDVEGLAFSADGVLYGVDDITKTLITINLETGQGTPVGSGNGNLGLPAGPGEPRDFGLTFDADGTLWLSSDVTGQVWRVNPDTGVAQEAMAGTGAAVSASNGDGVKSHATSRPHLTGLAACGSDLYGISVGGEQRLYRIRRNPVSAEIVGALGAGLEFDDGGLAFDASGDLWGIADRSTYQPPGASEPDVLDQPSIIFRVDPRTGGASRVAETVIGVEALAIIAPGDCLQEQAQAIPVPATRAGALALLALALLGLGWRASRRAA